MATPAKNIKNMSIENKMNIISKLLKKPKNAIKSLYLKKTFKTKSKENTLNSKRIRLIDLSQKSNISNKVYNKKRIHTNRGK